MVIFSGTHAFVQPAFAKPDIEGPDNIRITGFDMQFNWVWSMLGIGRFLQSSGDLLQWPKQFYTDNTLTIVTASEIILIYSIWSLLQWPYLSNTFNSNAIVPHNMKHEFLYVEC